MPENRKVRFVKAKLKGAARLWWHNIENQAHRTGQPPIDTWDEMKLKMKEHFLPTDYEQLMYTKLFSLKQARYKAGLRMEIQLEMNSCTHLTASKPLSTSNFRTPNHVNGGDNTQQTSNVAYKNEPESELESYPKEEETYNEDEVSEECDYYDVEEFKEQDKEYPANARKILDDFSDLWPAELPNELPPMRDIQHAIDLIPGASLPNLPAYRMNPTEHAELKRQVDELLTKGFIRESLSPCGVPALLTPKKDGSWRIYDGFGSVIFSKIDLRSGYHQIRIRPGDEWKTSFKTKDGLYEWLVMPFGLTNAPSTFMRIMTQIRRRSKLLLIGPVPTNIHEAANKAFEEIKSKMVNPPILRLPDFEKVFEVACDASHVGIGAVLSQEGHPVAFFSEKLNGAKKKYSTYDLEFYAVVQAIKHWQHYFSYKEFVLYSDHEALRYLNSQKKLNSWHAKWSSFLQLFTFNLKHCAGIENKVADALSRKTLLLVNMSTTTIGFEELKHCYDNDADFGDVYSSLLSGSKATCIDFQILEGYLFYKNRLCLPRTSLRDHVIWELHGAEWADILDEIRPLLWWKIASFWPSLKKDVWEGYQTMSSMSSRKRFKAKIRRYIRHYQFLSKPWEDLSMDFVLGLPRDTTGL
ncbi:Transposon Tf2-12 polyprotein [Vitis vinifera]|uniref:Transposon Tf2-12 polyprotein n=1 Tax=Vitis vinifera TaxID=29760 RepID=A0A438ETJ9_VITVI|nr:Transposon Tf2-12 polyprotein [Vitis vinifera]